MPFQNSLAAKFPDIAKEWHPIKNGGLTPSAVMQKTDKKVWWLCRNFNNHEWETSVSSRTSAGSGCPYCSGTMASQENNLLKLYPDIAEEWHPTKNGSEMAADFRPKSDKYVFWLCKQGHSYRSQIKKGLEVTGAHFVQERKYVRITTSHINGLT